MAGPQGNRAGNGMPLPGAEGKSERHLATPNAEEVLLRMKNPSALGGPVDPSLSTDLIDPNSERAKEILANSPEFAVEPGVERDKIVPRGQGIMVKAIDVGWWQGSRVAVGEEFEIAGPHRLGSWMMPLDPELAKLHAKAIKEKKKRNGSGVIHDYSHLRNPEVVAKLKNKN